MRRRFLLLSLSWIALGGSATAAERAPAWPLPDWQASTPEAEGMDSAVLAQLVEYGIHAQMDSLVVVRNGRLVAEAYYAPFRPDMKHRINSATKAVVGVLAGIAIGRGELPAPQASVGELLGDEALSQRWPGMTLQHLLDMTSGVEWTEPLGEGAPASVVALERSADWGRYLRERPLAHAPGTTFNYNSGNSHLVSLLLARSTGMSTQAYARQRLFEPLGITDWRWRTDPQGVAIGGYGLYLRTRDMARLGLLYLREGLWNGTQLVPRAWVRRVFEAQQPMTLPSFRYGDFWWTLPGMGAYMAVGYWRQWVLVLPQQGIVAAFTGRAHYPFQDVIRLLQRSARSVDALPDNPAGRDLLRARVQELAGERLGPAGRPGAAAAHATGAVFRFASNALGLQELALDLQAARPEFRLKVHSLRDPSRTRTLVRSVGVDGRYAEGLEEGTPVFARASWPAADTLLIEQRWPEETSSTTYVLKFEGDAVEVTHTSTMGVRTVLSGRRLAAP